MSNENRIAVFAIVATGNHAEVAIEALVRVGFPAGDISLIGPQGVSTREFAHERHTKAPEGTAAGAATGGVPGGTAEMLTRVGVVTLPGLGQVVAAGPLMAALASLGATGASGGLLGALAGSGVPEYEARRYQGRVKSGGVLLSIHCDSFAGVHLAKDVLEQVGAQDIDSAAEAVGIPETGRFMQVLPRL